MQNWLNREIARVTVRETNPPTPPAPIESTLEKNIIYMKEKLGASFDILYKQTSIGKNKAVLIMDDGMCDNLLVTQQVVNPIMTAEDMPKDASAQIAYIRDQISSGIDQKEIYNLDDAITEVLSGVVVLLIDEPTNDIDVNTLRALEEGLETFAGCAVVISHDRWFLDRICTHILAFEGNGEVFFFEGSYSEYEINKARRLGDTEIKKGRYRKLMEE